MKRIKKKNITATETRTGPSVLVYSKTITIHNTRYIQEKISNQKNNIFKLYFLIMYI